MQIRTGWYFISKPLRNTFIASTGNMKVFIICLAALFSLQAIAQSPGLTINVSMDSIEAGSIRYKIEMKLCEPLHKTDKGSWFSHDTSKIDFASIKPGEIDCGQYFDNGMPTLISGQEEEPLINKFKFSNQVFAWEKIIVFRITNVSSRGLWPPMYIVMPIPYKSFRTHVDLTNIEFRSGRMGRDIK